jgi:APA family basic amino acid/polyamine antiporter
MAHDAPSQLRRALSLPWLVFYGVGVTIGAGIFALIGEIVAIAGSHAPLAFFVAGVVAGLSGFSYAILASAYPRAAGEAIFVKLGLGEIAGRIIGYGVVAVAITSSAVIGLAFARYVASFSGVPEAMSLLAVMAFLSMVAAAGVRESVGFAAVVTVLEVGALLVVAVAGLPMAARSPLLGEVLSLPTDWTVWSAVFAGGFVAFFAFIGFEDIENMAEETHDAQRVVPLAILLTLVISVVIYGLVAVVAASWPDREALVTSRAPLADLFQHVTGQSGTPMAVMAAVAMINGILVQIIMASRVLYGMAGEGMAPRQLRILHARRQTPVRAILLVGAAAAALGLFVPLLRLAELTSLVMLAVFAAVNVSLFLIGRRGDAPPRLRRWRYWGLFGAAVTIGLIVLEASP